MDAWRNGSDERVFRGRFIGSLDENRIAFRYSSSKPPSSTTRRVTLNTRTNGRTEKNGDIGFYDSISKTLRVDKSLLVDWPPDIDRSGGYGSVLGRGRKFCGRDFIAEIYFEERHNLNYFNLLIRVMAWGGHFSGLDRQWITLDFITSLANDEEF